MGVQSRSNVAHDAKFVGGRRYAYHNENRRHYQKRAPVQDCAFAQVYTPEFAPKQCAYYVPECYSYKPQCCTGCREIQDNRAEYDCRKGNRSQALARRDVTKIQRQPGQALPGRIVPPAYFTHNPYATDVESADSTSAAVFKPPCKDPLCYDMPACQAPVKESTAPLYHAHDETTFDVSKNLILCLRWVNGTCGEKRKNATPEEKDTPIVCPYAHPDLSEVPPGVCPTYWFTGFCRFDRRDQNQVEPEDENEFGLHGWNHFKRLESVSDDSSSDGDKKKSRRRPPSVCYACHHAQPVGGFPLLPGISCKTTVLEREAALAMYPKWY